MMAAEQLVQLHPVAQVAVVVMGGLAAIALICMFTVLILKM